jgi:hypothetical protein
VERLWGILQEVFLIHYIFGGTDVTPSALFFMIFFFFSEIGSPEQFSGLALNNDPPDQL